MVTLDQHARPQFDVRGEFPKRAPGHRTGVSVPLRQAIPLGKKHLATAEVWRHHLQHGRDRILRSFPRRRKCGLTPMQLVTAVTGMAQKECFALARLRKALAVGTVLEVTTVDVANAGAVLAGLKNSLLGGRNGEAKPEMTNSQEAEAAIREDPATAAQRPFGWPLLRSSSEQRDSQSHVTRCVELLFLWRP